MAHSRANVCQPTGFILQNCTIVEDASLRAEKATIQVFLGRPWGEYSRTIIIESFIGDVIRAEGYTLWNGTLGIDTLFYSEFNNRGLGAPKDKRVKWKGIKELSCDEIKCFTPKQYIKGDTWIPTTKNPPGAAGGNEELPFQANKNCYNTQATFQNNTCV